MDEQPLENEGIENLEAVKLREDLSRLDTRLNEALRAYNRLQAERDRIELISNNRIREERIKFLDSMLPLLRSLESYTSNESCPLELREAYRIVMQQNRFRFFFPEIGSQFDYETQEVAYTVNVEEPSKALQVQEVISPAFFSGDELVSLSKVSVSVLDKTIK